MMSNLIDLEISISSVHILQQSGIWDIEDILPMFQSNPDRVALILARIKYEDFTEIVSTIKENRNKI